MTKSDRRPQTSNPSTISPDVSVLLITYNHEAYIDRAVDSILIQRGVDFEVIASEDCSTDRTLEVIRSKLGGCAGFRLMASERNLGSNEVILRAIRGARGRYIAILDGDDFWIADDKLARQVALLDADQSVSACFHNAVIVRGDDDAPGEERWTPASQPARVGLAELWEGNPFATCAGMIRRDALGSVGDWYSRLGRPTDTPMVTDWPLYLAAAEHGDIRLVDEPVGAYRLHDGGCFSSLPLQQKLDATAKVYRLMRAGLGKTHQSVAAAGAARYFVDWMTEYRARGARRLARSAGWHALGTGGVGTTIGWRRWLQEFAHTL